MVGGSNQDFTIVKNESGPTYELPEIWAQKI